MAPLAAAASRFCCYSHIFWISQPRMDCPVVRPVISGANCFVIRGSLAKLVRRMQHRHDSADIRVVLNQIAATFQQWKNIKMTRMITKWRRCLLYDDSQRKRLGRAIPATRATPRMRSAVNVCQSRRYVKDSPATPSGKCKWTMRLNGLTRGQNLNDSHDPTIFSPGCLDRPRASAQEKIKKKAGAEPSPPFPRRLNTECPP